MGKSKSTKKATAKTRKPVNPAVEAVTHGEPKEGVAREDLCVFPFRLTPEEREATHKAGRSGQGLQVRPFHRCRRLAER